MHHTIILGTPEAEEVAAGLRLLLHKRRAMLDFAIVMLRPELKTRITARIERVEALLALIEGPEV